jgi:hypothetical protein
LNYDFLRNFCSGVRGGKMGSGSYGGDSLV